MSNKEKQLLTTDALSAQVSEDVRPLLIACEKFTAGLNSTPSASKIKERQRVKYIPISGIEAELDRMFAGLWQTKNMKWQVVVNEIVVSIDLEVFHPIAKVWICRSGVGAAQIRQSKGAGISDINAKIKNALEMDVPHAKADAIKNAAKSLGKLFGRDLGRKPQDVSQYEPILLNKIKQLKKQEDESGKKGA